MYKTANVTAAEIIASMIGLGPIVAIDGEIGIAITVNGAYLNAWSVYDGREPVNFDCRAMPRDLYQTTGVQMMDLAREYLEDILMGDDEDEDEDDE